MKFTQIRSSNTLANAHHQTKRATTTCGSAFYTAPAWDTVMPSTQPLTISWSTSAQSATCLGNAANIDIYLLSNQIVSDGKVQKFTPIKFSDGTYTRALDPKWWNGLPNVQMEVVITPSGTPLFNNPMPVGPLFNVTYNGVETAASNVTSSDPNLGPSASILQKGTLSNGVIAVAVLIPILALAGFLFFYIKFSRGKVAQQTRRFTQAMDARMSRLSVHWQAQDVRQSQAGGARESTMRMSTVYAQGMVMDTRPSEERPSVSIYGRPSGETVGTRASRFNPTLGAERQSRISFAADVNTSRERLSTYSQGRTSRAYHNGTAPPPVPAIRTTSFVERDLPEVEEYEYEDERALSPTQTQGPHPLEDITPALRLMRTGAAQSSEDLLLSPPVPPTPVAGGGSPFSPLGGPPLSPVGMMPMQPHYAAYMSPDAMLRQYAERSKSPVGSMPTPMSPIYSLPPLSPLPSTPGIQQYTASGMRNLTGDSSLSHQQQQQADWHY